MAVQPTRVIADDPAYWEAVRGIVDEAPPLSEAQRDRLAVLLNEPDPFAEAIEESFRCK